MLRALEHASSEAMAREIARADVKDWQDRFAVCHSTADLLYVLKKLKECVIAGVMPVNRAALLSAAKAKRQAGPELWTQEVAAAFQSLLLHVTH